MPQPVDRGAQALAVLSGTALRTLAHSGHLARLRARHLAPDPDSAIRRIVATFGTRPTRLGGNVWGIVALRNAIWAVTRDAEVANALVISAPHTHWDSDLPIIIAATAAGYRIGPAAPREHGRYTPVSFIFSAEGPVAYEWADDSIALVPEDLARAWQAIQEVAEIVAEHEWPLGLSLNFRFKALLDDAQVATLEYQEDGAGAAGGPAVIAKAAAAIGAHDESSFEQVAWHGYSDHAYALEAEERAVLAEIRAQLDGIEQFHALQAALQHLLDGVPRTP